MLLQFGKGLKHGTTDIDQSLSRSGQFPVFQLFPLQVLKSSLMEYNSYYALQRGNTIENQNLWDTLILIKYKKL